MYKKLSLLLIAMLVLSGFAGISTFTSGGSEGDGLADSPWPCYGHDRRRTGRSPYDTSEVNGTVRWNYDADNRAVHSSPTIGSDGTIYFGTASIPPATSTLTRSSLKKYHKIYAINPNGTKKWDFTTGNEVWWSSPAVSSDGTVYVGSYGDDLYAINPDGTEKWTFSIGNARSSPVIGGDGTIYIGSNDGDIYAIYPDGTEKWNMTIGSGEVSSPAIGSGGTVYVGSEDNKLYAINPNGTMKWNYTTDGDVSSSPAIDSDGTVYVGSNDGNLYAINPDGTEKRTFSISVGSSPAIGSDGTVYIGSGNNKLYAVNQDGTERWNLSLNNSGITTPVTGADGTIYIGTGWVKHGGTLYAVNSNGTIKWAYTMSRAVYSSPAIGSNNIYVGSLDGNLYAFGGVGEKITDEDSEKGWFFSYKWLLLSVAIVSVLSVISIVLWKKKTLEKDHDKKLS